MQIRIHLKIFLFIALFYLTKQIEIYAIMMLFAFIHELGHMVAGILLGLKIQKIELMPLGFTVAFKVDASYYNKKIKNGNLLNLKKIWIAIAGPILNFAIATLFYKIDISIFHIPREIVIYTNLLIGIFNLLPIYPLDGGRILKEIVHIQKGFKKSIIYTNVVANSSIILLTAISSIAIYYFKNIAILLILLYLWILVVVENKKYKARMRVYQLLDK